MKRNRIHFALAAGAIWVGFCAPAFAQELSPDPLGDIALSMNVASRRLSKTLTDKPTQEVQQEAIDQLDLLIKELEKQCAQCQGGGNRPMKPAQASNILSGPGGIGTLRAPRPDGRQWADLRPHERERITQSMNEGFPAHYQKVLEEYFKRLAEEKPAGDADAPPPAKAPDKAPEAKAPETTPAANGK